MTSNEVSTALRYSMWTERSDVGESQRGKYETRGEAVENAGKYWLTSVGLFRVFVRDADEGGAIVFERRYGVKDGR